MTFRKISKKIAEIKRSISKEAICLVLAEKKEMFVNCFLLMEIKQIK